LTILEKLSMRLKILMNFIIKFEIKKKLHNFQYKSNPISTVYSNK